VTASRSLLERLEDPDDGKDRQLEANLQDQRDSIRRNLHQLLNSVRGGTQVASDYGLTALADLKGDSSFKVTSEEIRQAIEKFEPRLTNVKVQFVGTESHSPGELRFDISAMIVSGAKGKPAVFHSVVAPSGQIRIRRS